MGMDKPALLGEAERLIGLVRPLIVSDVARTAIDKWFGDSSGIEGLALHDAVPLVRLAWALVPGQSTAAKNWVDTYYATKE